MTFMKKNGWTTGGVIAAFSVVVFMAILLRVSFDVTATQPTTHTDARPITQADTLAFIGYAHDYCVENYGAPNVKPLSFKECIDTCFKTSGSRCMIEFLASRR